MWSRLPWEQLPSDSTPFTDVNFKLTVIDALIEMWVLNFGTFPGFLRWIEGPGYDYEEDGYQLSSRAYEYLARYPLTNEQLALVKTIEFDGGLGIYPYIYPFWGGETEDFDIRSLKDIALLPNLTRFGVYSMLADNDLEPLKHLKKLEVLTLGLSGREWQNMDALKRLSSLTHVTVFHSDTQSPANKRMLRWFRDRGVIVQIH